MATDFTAYNKVEISSGLLRKEGTSKQSYLFDGDGVLFPNSMVQTFDVPPICVDDAGYGNPTGTAADVNRMLVGGDYFEYCIKGTQTIVAPAWTASGLNIGMDQADND
jgi:hypothetical protein